MLPEEHAHMLKTISLIDGCLSQKRPRDAFKRIKSALRGLHSDLLPLELKRRLSSETRYSDSFARSLEEAKTHLVQFQAFFDRAWTQPHARQSTPQRFTHQKDLRLLVRLRRTEAAQFLNAAYWMEHENESGKHKSLALQNTIPFSELLFLADKFKKTGLWSSAQSRIFIDSVLEQARLQPSVLRVKGQERRLDPQSVRVALSSAWGASAAVKRGMDNWTSVDVNRILGLDKIVRPPAESD